MKAKHWKTLTSTVILDYPRMQLVEDTVELPNGKTASYVRHAPAKARSVAVIAINERQEILLQKEYSYPPDSIMWQLPGGGAGEQEDIVVAANRELSEESGLMARFSKVLGWFYINSRRSDEKQYVVLCKDLQSKTAQSDDEEFIETHWVAVAELRSMITKGEFQNMPLLAALNLWFCVSGPKFSANSLDEIGLPQ